MNNSNSQTAYGVFKPVGELDRRVLAQRLHDRVAAELRAMTDAA